MADAIWLDVLPSMRGFAASLTAGSVAAALTSGKTAGIAWSKSFGREAQKNSAQKLVDELTRASRASSRAVSAETMTIAKARGAQKDAAAKVAEAEGKLSALRAKGGNASQLEAAELRLGAARDREQAATVRVTHSEETLAAAHRSHKENTDQLTDAQGKLDVQSGKTAGSQTRLGKAMGGINFAAVAAGSFAAAGAVGSLLVSATQTAAGFEAKMNGVQAVSGATGVEMQKLSAKAIQLGADTVFSAGDAADAMGELVKAGLPVQAVLDGAADAAVNMAAASGVDMATAATIASNAMNGFNLKARDMAGVADLIAGAANASAIDVGDFGQSLAQSAAVAHTAGLDFHDTAVAIAELGNAGIKGSDAGTSLKTMLLNLSPSSTQAASTMEYYGLISLNAGKAKDMLAKLGIEVNKSTTKKFAAPDFSTYSRFKEQLIAYFKTTEKLGASEAMVKANRVIMQYGAASSAFFDESTGKAKSLIDIQGALSKSLAGVGNEERMKALQTMFGTDAMRAASVLTMQGAKGYKDMAKAMGAVSAEQVAQTRMQGMAGAVESMKGSFESLSIVVGTHFLPVATKVALWFADFAGFASRHGKIVTAVAVTFTVLAAAIGIAALSVMVFSAALWANPVTWIVAGVIALIAAIVALALNWSTVTAFVKREWGQLGSWMSVNVIQPVKRGFDSMVAGLSVAWKAISSGAHAAWDGLKSVVSTALSAIVGFVARWTLPGLIVTHWSAIKGAFSAALGWVQSTFSGAWRVVSAILVLPLNLAVTLVRMAWSWIQGAFSTALTWVRTIFAIGWASLKSLLHGPLMAAQAAISVAWSAIRNAFSVALNWVRTAFAIGWAALRGLLVGPLTAARDALAAAWAAIRNAFSTALNWVRTSFIAGWNALKAMITKPIDDAKAAVGRALDAMGNAFSAATRAISAAWSGVQDVVKKPIRFVIQTVLNDGLIAGFNKVANFAHSPTIPTIPLGFKEGGVIPGAWSASNRDNVLGVSRSGVPTARVEPGEMVVNRDSTMKHFALLHAINNDELPAYAGGGVVGGSGSWTSLFASRMQMAADKLGLVLQIAQRGFRPATSYSGTSHQGDAVDAMGPGNLWSIRNALRSVGIDAWVRGPAQGYSWHVHGVPDNASVGQGAGSAIYQAQAYRAGGDGLHGMSTPDVYATAPAGTGTFGTSGQSGGIVIPDWLKNITKIFSGPLDRIKELGDSPIVGMVKGVATRAGGFLLDAAKSAASTLLGQIPGLSTVVSTVKRWTKGLFGYSQGTTWAQPGVAQVAEHGAELVVGRQARKFLGGEVVLNAKQTSTLGRDLRWMSAMKSATEQRPVFTGGTPAMVRNYAFHGPFGPTAEQIADSIETRARGTFFAEGLAYA